MPADRLPGMTSLSAFMSSEVIFPEIVNLPMMPCTFSILTSMRSFN